jgi:hypothetical protein
LLRRSRNAANEEAVCIEAFRRIEPFLVGNEVGPEERDRRDLANSYRCSPLRGGYLRCDRAYHENAECEDCRLFVTKH